MTSLTSSPGTPSLPQQDVGEGPAATSQPGGRKPATVTATSRGNCGLGRKRGGTREGVEAEGRELVGALRRRGQRRPPPPRSTGPGPCCATAAPLAQADPPHPSVFSQGHEEEIARAGGHAFRAAAGPARMEHAGGEAGPRRRALRGGVDLANNYGRVVKHVIGLNAVSPAGLWANRG